MYDPELAREAYAIRLACVDRVIQEGRGRPMNAEGIVKEASVLEKYISEGANNG